MKLHSYKELIVWQKSVRLACEIYQITEKFPRSEQFGLTSHKRRSAISIPSSIAEGRCKTSRKEFTRFLSISHGSARELETQLEIAHRLKLLNDEDFNSSLDLNNEN